MLTMLLASQSLGALLSLVITTTFFFALQNTRRFAIQLTTLFALSCLFYLSLYILPDWLSAKPLQNLGISVHDFNDKPRITLWGKALQMGLEAPFFGKGPMHYALTPNPYAAHPHNSILQIWSEWGLLALLSLGGILAFSLKKAFGKIHKYNSKRSNILLLTSFAFSISCAAIYSLVSGVIVTPLSQLSLACIGGLTLGFSRPGKVVEKDRATLPMQIVRSSTLVMALIYNGLIFEDIYLRLGDNYTSMEINLNTPGPRYWQFTNLKP